MRTPPRRGVKKTTSWWRSFDVAWRKKKKPASPPCSYCLLLSGFLLIKVVVVWDNETLCRDFFFFFAPTKSVAKQLLLISVSRDPLNSWLQPLIWSHHNHYLWSQEGGGLAQLQKSKQTKPDLCPFVCHSSGFHVISFEYLQTGRSHYRYIGLSRASGLCLPSLPDYYSHLFLSFAKKQLWTLWASCAHLALSHLWPTADPRKILSTTSSSHLWPL